MKLAALFDVPRLASEPSLLDREIAGITSDSRKVAPGYVFAALPGSKADGRAYIGRVGPAGGDNIEIALPPDYQRYGHFTAGTEHSDWLVSDGYWHPAGVPENGLWGGEWITKLQVDWEARRITWTPLCAHHSAWDCQDSHPHPVFSPGDRFVYFTSNLGGGRCVCRVGVPE